MTDETKVQSPAAVEDYARIWAESTARVLEQLKGAPFACTPLTAVGGAPADENAPEKRYLQAKISGSLVGEQAFEISTSDGVRFAQMLISEPLDAAAAFTPAHADALSELFRQFAGLATAACKTRFSGEPSFEWRATTAPQWPAAARSTWIFAAPQTPPLQWTLLMDASLLAALESVAASASSALPAAPPASASAAAGAASSRASAPQRVASAKSAEIRPETEKLPASADTPANLDLLLDVVLDASLRFGQREMLLRDILELRPGSVIELNRNVQEPAELLVGGRVIARGDVVIVDGNYGLRITDITKPRERLESIETGE